MRIRTIKPEFWSHEQMSALPSDIALLAIGLLNLADDEGYFNANPKLVQAAIFPLRETSVKLPVALQELSRIGYVELRTNKEQRFTGRVTNFLEHQVISHPKKSVLREVFEASEILPGTFPPPIRVSVSGKEGNGAGTGKGSRKRGDGFLPEQQPPEVRDRMIAINALKNRQADTYWSLKEMEAFRSAGLDRIDDAVFADQHAAMLAYYSATVAMLRPMWRARDSAADFRRRDLLTLLNNWASELDRAREWVHWVAKNSNPEEGGMGRL